MCYRHARLIGMNYTKKRVERFFVYNEYMTEETDISYGVVPLFKDKNEWNVLVVHQISYRGDDFWILPKGHAEGAETPVQAARRELAEEAGVTEVTIPTDTQFSIEYSFTHENSRIHKTVIYFVGLCKTKHNKITQPQEIKELRWCTFTEAQKLLSHQNSRNILKQVQEVVEDLQ